MLWISGILSLAVFVVVRWVVADGDCAARAHAAAGDRKPDQQRQCDSREEAGRRGDDGEPGHDDRHEEGREPDVADLLLEDADGEEER